MRNKEYEEYEESKEESKEEFKCDDVGKSSSIALVDIDGTLVLDDESFNEGLIQRLKNYDRVFLVTQRCAPVTQKQLNSPEYMDEIDCSISLPRKFKTRLTIEKLENSGVKLAGVGFGLSHQDGFNEWETEEFLEVEEAFVDARLKFPHEDPVSYDQLCDSIKDSKSGSTMVNNLQFYNISENEIYNKPARNKNPTVKALIDKYKLPTDSGFAFFDDSFENCKEMLDWIDDGSEEDHKPDYMKVFHVRREDGDIAEVASDTNQETDLLHATMSECYRLVPKTHRDIAWRFLKQYGVDPSPYTTQYEACGGWTRITFTPRGEANSEPVIELKVFNDLIETVKGEDILFQGRLNRWGVVGLDRWDVVEQHDDGAYEAYEMDYFHMSPFTLNETKQLLDFRRSVKDLPEEDSTDDKKSLEELKEKYREINIHNLQAKAREFTNQLMKNAVTKHALPGETNFLQILNRILNENEQDLGIIKRFPLMNAFNSSALLDMCSPLNAGPERDSKFEKLVQAIDKSSVDSVEVKEIMFILNVRFWLQQMLGSLFTNGKCLDCDDASAIKLAFGNPFIAGGNTAAPGYNGTISECYIGPTRPVDMDGSNLIPKGSKGEPIANFFPKLNPIKESYKTNRSTRSWYGAAALFGVVTVAVAALLIPPVGLAVLGSVGLISASAAALPLAATIATAITAGVSAVVAVSSLYKGWKNRKKNTESMRENELPSEKIKKNYIEADEVAPKIIIKPCDVKSLAAENIFKLIGRITEISESSEITSEIKRYISDENTLEKLLFIGPNKQFDFNTSNLDPAGITPTAELDTPRRVAHLYLAMCDNESSLSLMHQNPGLMTQVSAFIRGVMIKKDNNKTDLDLCKRLLVNENLKKELMNAPVGSKVASMLTCMRSSDKRPTPIQLQKLMDGNTFIKRLFNRNTNLVDVWRSIQSHNISKLQQALRELSPSDCDLSDPSLGHILGQAKHASLTDPGALCPILSELIKLPNLESSDYIRGYLNDTHHIIKDDLLLILKRQLDSKHLFLLSRKQVNVLTVSDKEAIKSELKSSDSSAAVNFLSHLLATGKPEVRDAAVDIIFSHSEQLTSDPSYPQQEPSEEIAKKVDTVRQAIRSTLQLDSKKSDSKSDLLNQCKQLMALMIVCPRIKDDETMRLGNDAASKIQSMPEFKKGDKKLTDFFRHTDVSEPADPEVGFIVRREG